MIAESMRKMLLAATAGLCLVLAALRAGHAADLSIGLAADVTTIDPHVLNAAPNNAIAEKVFGTLVERDPQQRFKPGLAESWRLVNDTTWEFKLRKGVKFHDGSELTSEDVAFSIDRPATMGAMGGFTVFTRPIVAKYAPDAHTIQLRTATPYPNLPSDLSSLAIVQKRSAQNAVTADFDSGKAAIGTGPYKLTRFLKGDRIELTRHEAYWGRKPAWDRVTLRLITNDGARIAALLAGDVHMIESVPPTDYARLKANNAITIFAGPSNRMIFFHLDSDRERTPHVTGKDGKPLDKNPLKDARVRRALSLAINREALTERVMEKLAIPAAQFVPPGFFGYVPGLKPDPYDPNAARKLLAGAGYPDGFGLTLHGPNNRYVNDEQVVQAVAQMLTRVGIQAKVEVMPFSVYIPRARKFDFSAPLLGWGVSTGEAGYALRSLVATINADKGNGTFNWSRYSNARVDQLTEQGLATVDGAKREAMLRDATRIALSEHAVLPLFYQVNTWAARKGYAYTPRTDERTYAHEVRATP
jgi:peptide/nickel transport system substrate-binding protein